MDLTEMINRFQSSGKVASFIATPPSQSFHLVDIEDGGDVTSIRPVTQSNLLINAGFFCLRPEIFDYIEPGEELVVEPFARLIAERKLMAWPYQRFWCMDTFKEQQQLSDMYNVGNAPWEVWKRPIAP
jgi:glucose-1-phosphate cytidylyltransferase